VSLSDRQQNALKADASPTIVGRKICSPEEGTTVGRKKCREWPSALSAYGGDCGLVASVHVGTFIAINLHRYEFVVDDFSDLRIVVRLAIHYVAPVAPHCADVEQDGLVLLLRLAKGLFTPFMPMDRLMHGRTQIGRRRICKRVSLHGAH